LRAKRRAALEQLDALVDATLAELVGDSGIRSTAWPEVRFGEVAGIQGGLQVTAARRSLPLELPYLRVANVLRNRLDLTEVKAIRASESEIARTLLQAGDLLFVEGHGNPDEIGRLAVWDGSIARCVHQNHLIRARCDQRVLLPQCATYYLNSQRGRKHLLRSGKTTSGLNTISVSDVKAAPVLLPPLAAQRDFARRVAAVEKLKAAHRASLTEMDALFASLQHRAFRGEL
jgi:type I restriction enzyme S subunit